MHSNIWLLSILILFTFSCQNSKAIEATVTVKRTPAEFEPQEAVWLIWSPIDHLEGYSNEKVSLEIIQTLTQNVKVIVTAANKELFQRAKQQIPDSLIQNELVKLIQLPSEELWVRDMGPNFVELENGQKAIVDFNFDAWGYTPIDQMDAYTIRMEKYDAEVASLKALPVIKSNLVSEGGDREVNGEGTLMVVEAVEKGRNPSMSLEEMETEFKRVLGVSKVIWLKQGVYEDDHTFLGPLKTEEGALAYTVVTTNGHIDEFARFANDSTILLAEIDSTDLSDPIAIENMRRMEVNYEILKNATDQDGKPFKIVRVPMPHTILGEMKPGDSVYDFISTLDYQDGSTFPKDQPVSVIAAASYLNFLISNELIIGQKYWREGLDLKIKKRDEEVAQILSEVFPKRKIVMLDALAINYGGGGIHCITMQEPIIN